jgi:hypothetical protein
MVNDHIDRSGDTFMMPSGMAGGERVRARYTISNGVLSIDTGAKLTRIAFAITNPTEERQ